MKISAEVREFARLNPSPLEGEGDSPAASGAEARSHAGGMASTGGAVEEEAPSAEEGMAAMSQLYRAGGSELYIGANVREHD